MFIKKSRYVKQTIETATDSRGRPVSIVLPPDKPAQTFLGFHVLKQGQRIDHMAFKYLQDHQGFWRIAEYNNVMHSEQLSEKAEIAIPREKG
ncbi:MAG: hypothetical protein AAF431_00360 [Pseudomonadota bacterium]